MKRASRRKREERDPVLEEFENKDLGEDMERSGSAVVIRPEFTQKPTSIFLSPHLIEKLREKAAKRGIGYQTLLKMIVHEHLNEY